MILIPEAEIVLVLVPRTGSGSLRRAVSKRYPKSLLLYRHMEADGVPAGYDHWHRIGVVRHPLARLYSLYRFCKSLDVRPDRSAAYCEKLARSVDMPFEEWLMHNEVVFTAPYDTADPRLYHPFFTVKHALPENRKSQYLYLRPDLGTEIYRYTDLSTLARRLDVTLGAVNQTGPYDPISLSPAGQAYLERVFGWDLRAAA